MLEYCIAMASKMPYVRKETRVYSVVCDKRGRIISESPNSYIKTHPLVKRWSFKANLDKEYLHAECGAIIKSKGKGHSLYVARVDSKNNPMIAKPCPVCQIAIEQHGSIKEVYWT